MKKVQVVAAIMRVVIGILFVFHGVDKFQMGLGNVEGWFSSIGVPGFLAYVVAIAELVGGILLIIGLFTRYVSGLLIVILVGAIFSAKLSVGVLGDGQMAGYELDLAFILVLLHLFVAEPLFAVDRLIAGKRNASAAG
ncbi:oxidoreductase [Paenibacillus sp. 598K]|uniref:DoxX family protein n=1 Tax=Paenibacillus sp. 598K TaxID=1117987 RepID=UPI000FFA178C|nr:DoxX family protein [Paenibacillus sp. 598K]GBF77104.1 oxidoreductase [Paenibacillus sp. 598K]